MNQNIKKINIYVFKDGDDSYNSCTLSINCSDGLRDTLRYVKSRLGSAYGKVKHLYVAQSGSQVSQLLELRRLQEEYKDIANIIKEDTTENILVDNGNDDENLPECTKEILVEDKPLVEKIDSEKTLKLHELLNKYMTEDFHNSTMFESASNLYPLIYTVANVPSVLRKPAGGERKSKTSNKAIKCVTKPTEWYTCSKAKSTRKSGTKATSKSGKNKTVDKKSRAAQLTPSDSSCSCSLCSEISGQRSQSKSTKQKKCECGTDTTKTQSKKTFNKYEQFVANQDCDSTCSCYKAFKPGDKCQISPDKCGQRGLPMIGEFDKDVCTCEPTSTAPTTDQDECSCEPEVVQPIETVCSCTDEKKDNPQICTCEPESQGAACVCNADKPTTPCVCEPAVTEVECHPPEEEPIPEQEPEPEPEPEVQEVEEEEPVIEEVIEEQVIEEEQPPEDEQQTEQEDNGSGEEPVPDRRKLSHEGECDSECSCYIEMHLSKYCKHPEQCERNYDEFFRTAHLEPDSTTRVTCKQLSNIDVDGNYVDSEKGRDSYDVDGNYILDSPCGSNCMCMNCHPDQPCPKSPDVCQANYNRVHGIDDYYDDDENRFEEYGGPDFLFYNDLTEQELMIIGSETSIYGYEQSVDKFLRRYTDLQPKLNLGIAKDVFTAMDDVDPRDLTFYIVVPKSNPMDDLDELATKMSGMSNSDSSSDSRSRSRRRSSSRSRSAHLTCGNRQSTQSSTESDDCPKVSKKKCYSSARQSTSDYSTTDRDGYDSFNSYKQHRGKFQNKRKCRGQSDYSYSESEDGDSVRSSTTNCWCRTIGATKMQSSSQSTCCCYQGKQTRSDVSSDCPCPDSRTRGGGNKEKPPPSECEYSDSEQSEETNYRPQYRKPTKKLSTFLETSSCDYSDQTTSESANQPPERYKKQTKPGTAFSRRR